MPPTTNAPSTDTGVLSSRIFLGAVRRRILPLLLAVPPHAIIGRLALALLHLRASNNMSLKKARVLIHLDVFGFTPPALSHLGVSFYICGYLSGMCPTTYLVYHRFLYDSNRTLTRSLFLGRFHPTLRRAVGNPIIHPGYKFRYNTHSTTFWLYNGLWCIGYIHP